MIESRNVRFFTFAIADSEIDIFEISEKQFLSLTGLITYERHSVFENGVDQVCLTIEPVDYPDFSEI